MRKDRHDREGRPKPKPSPKVQRFTVILDALKGGKIVSTVPREILLEALDEYSRNGVRWMVVEG